MQVEPVELLYPVLQGSTSLCMPPPRVTHIFSLHTHGVTTPRLNSGVCQVPIPFRWYDYSAYHILLFFHIFTSMQFFQVCSSLVIAKVNPRKQKDLSCRLQALVTRGCLMLLRITTALQLMAIEIDPHQEKKQLLSETGLRPVIHPEWQQPACSTQRHAWTGPYLVWCGMMRYEIEVKNMTRSFLNITASFWGCAVCCDIR